MTTTNIGPCACCGGGECPCSNCLLEWQYSETLLVYQWVVIDYCGGGDGSTERCCGCPPPSQPGEYEGQQIQMECTGTNRCSCCQCSATWDEFLGEWVIDTSCIDINSNICGNCNCVTPVNPGTYHGELSGPIPCGC